MLNNIAEKKRLIFFDKIETFLCSIIISIIIYYIDVSVTRQIKKNASTTL